MAQPFYKIVYRHTVKPVLNIVTLRRVRKKLKLAKIRKQVRNIEKNFPNNTVLIFQHQFFDFGGKQCFNGGAERYVKDLAKILSDENLTPILIQMSDSGLWDKTVENLRVIGIPSAECREFSYDISCFSKYKFVIYSGATDWGKKLHPNILISHGITWDAPYADVNPIDIFNIFKDVDKFVSVDTNTISWVRSTFSKTLRKFDANYIPNYVDTKIYCPIKRKNDGKIHITFPRRASPERGYWLMSAALPPILDKYNDVVFQFVGFAHGHDIQKDILQLEKNYPNRVSHCMVEPDEMVKIYQNTDISLIPTLYCEGTSLSCLEAQACGNVVISTNVGGLPDLIIDGFNGLLINPTGQDLMKALDKVLADADLREKLSQNAINVAAAFDKQKWIDKWKTIIYTVISKGC